jgi:hypothetical protein
MIGCKSRITKLLSQNAKFCAVFGVGGSESPALLPGSMQEPPFPALQRTFCALNAARSA